MTMARKTILLTLGLSLLLPGTAGAGHGGADVLIRDDAFSPDAVLTFVFVDSFPTRAVEWEGDPANLPTNEHNVRELHGIFSSGPPELWTTQVFSLNLSAGRFGYQCVVHGPSMSGVVNVRPLLLTPPAPDQIPVQWASEATETGQAFDAQYRVGPAGRWRNWKVDTTRFKGVFGRNDRPVPLEPGTDYYVRVRSQKRVDTPNAHSRYYSVLLD
jgi:hypothetical protein